MPSAFRAIAFASRCTRSLKLARGMVTLSPPFGAGAPPLGFPAGAGARAAGAAAGAVPGIVV
jgi:hypothetical protein